MLGEIQAGPVFFPCQAETNGQSNAQPVQKRAATIHPDWAPERTKPAEPNEALVNYFNRESFQGLFLDNRTSLEQLSC